MYDRLMSKWLWREDNIPTNRLRDPGGMSAKGSFEVCVLEAHDLSPH